MNYNLLNYPLTVDVTERNVAFRTIITAVLPDILVAEEMQTQTGVNLFLNSVLNVASSGYAAGTFIDGPDSDNAIFYRSSKFTFISNTRIKTDLRDINEFKLKHLLSGDTIRIYAVHLKSSNTGTDEAKRLVEIDSLRKVTDLLPNGSNFIVCGDFNIYNSSESCYLKLKQVSPGVQGHVFDPLTLPGSWNNLSYAAHHTQSPRIRSFGGGVTGGMDDRFDLILYSSGLATAGGVDYVSGSLVTYGNDGRHYNDSINSVVNNLPNTAVGQTIANALHTASDHIPVYATLNFNYSSPVAEDFGVQTITSPATVLCPADNQSLIVTVKNYSALSVNFTTNNLPVQVKVTSPSAIVTTYSGVINSGTIAAGGTVNITLTNLLNLTTGGAYSLKCYTQSTSDVNHLNDTNNIIVQVQQVTPATTSPSGNVVLCTGNILNAAASSGAFYQWSDGSTSSSIDITSAGNYIVTVTDSIGCTSVSSALNVVLSSGSTSINGTVFTETMGSPSGTATIASYESSNGFDNDNFTMSGTGDIRNTGGSSGYTSASGSGNVFLTSAATKSFLIAGINTSSYQNLQLSFGVSKSTTASNGSDLSVKYSTDGINYTSLSFPLLPTGSGTAVWHYVTVTTPLPSVPVLYIQFINNSALAQYRLDDINLTYAMPVTQIGSFTPPAGSSGDTVYISGYGFNQTNAVYFGNDPSVFNVINDTLLSTVVPAGAANSILKITTTACNTVFSADSFMVNQNSGVTINVSLLIEGFYLGDSSMVSDSVDVALHEPVAPYDLYAHVKQVFSGTGTESYYFPSAIINNSYYLVFHHRNSVATWSKFPILLNAPVINFNLGSP
ncbi:MAG: endonuclease/exonuclease/phosphatase family protein [Bacteroidota bacterium]